MSVRAKFRVDSITQHSTGKWVDNKCVAVEMRTVKLMPVYSSDPNHENKKFWDATPTGAIEIGCANLEAAAQFELGKEYYVDFTPAE